MVPETFHPLTGEWFSRAFSAPTTAQDQGWTSISRGEHTLILAPTGSGKTLAAFLWVLDRLMFEAPPDSKQRCRALYISPLKALAIDVERNLRAPLAGIANLAERSGVPFHSPVVGLRTGDTPAGERARLARHPADILITTPESLYLVLTSQAREALRSVRWVIVDEIHTMVSGKRGAHLALSLERLTRLCGAAPQRIGLSATQRPLDEVARFLGGGEVDDAGWQPRPVAVVDAGVRKRLDLSVEVPVEDMARLVDVDELPSGPVTQAPRGHSIWPAIYPRLVELIRGHRTTLIFVNSRRLAERVANAVNELAGETLAYAHHGAVAREQRIAIEDGLKAGRIPAIVATSTLELGIDMGSVDLVVQVEAPPSVASGLQRIGRAGHQVDAPSTGVIVPKYRGDLLACAGLTRGMLDGAVEATHYPRNPLDVLAQQIVAMCAMDDWTVDDLARTVRQAAPFAELSRSVLENVLDMLSGRYPADEFAELRPRITWDRLSGTLTAREGARRVAVINGGTIPDRGLYGVFLAGAERSQSARVGELDEEMVHESRVGETFVLGASTWRIEAIEHDRVIVSPAPGEPGKMPFWRGDAVGRDAELGQSIGALVRQLEVLPESEATRLLMERNALDERAARNLLAYLSDQRQSGSAVPDDQTIVAECSRDELGDWRICFLSPFGSRVHAPLSLAVEALARRLTDADVEVMWSDDGFVVRFPDTEQPPDPARLLPASDDVQRIVSGRLASSAIFGARFREAAARALLLPRRRPGLRTPLWQQRKRAGDLLQIAAGFGSFPILLEAYRECLQDVFDLPALISLLQQLEGRQVRLVVRDTDAPSPFAASLLFNYVANYLYDGDAPLAERRAQALVVDQSQLRELLGEAELRELLDRDVLAELELQLQRLAPGRGARSADGLHDLLLRLGDLSRAEIEARSQPTAAADSWISELLRARRIAEVSVAGEARFIAAEDAGRYRDALGVPLPAGLPDAFLEPVRTPLLDITARYARTHGPFTTAELAQRYGLGVATAEPPLRELEASGRIVQGELRPGGREREWCDADVLRSLRQRSLARVRREAEPVEQAVFGRFLPAWHGVGSARRGLDSLLEVIEQLQGAPLIASTLETAVLPARLVGYSPGDLDTLCAAGEVVWTGLEPLGERDGRVALYLTDHAAALLPPMSAGLETPLHERVREYLRQHGASFFADLHAELGGWATQLLDALWDLVWAGEITNDGVAPLRAFLRPARDPRRRPGHAAFRSRRNAPPAGAGRWSLVESLRAPLSPTERATALSRQLLERHGVLTREALQAEKVAGGFSAVYPVLRAMEEGGRIRRGYFVAGLGASQFGPPSAVEHLRQLRQTDDDPDVYVLAASDPANPYGAALRWPARVDGAAMSRSAGALVILVDGRLIGYLGRSERDLLTCLADEPAERGRQVAGLADGLVRAVNRGLLSGLQLSTVDGEPAASSGLRPALQARGFRPGGQAMYLRSIGARDAGAEAESEEIDA